MIVCRSTVPARLRAISMTARSLASGCTSSTPKPPVLSAESTIVAVIVAGDLDAGRRVSSSRGRSCAARLPDSNRSRMGPSLRRSFGLQRASARRSACR